MHDGWGLWPGRTFGIAAIAATVWLAACAPEKPAEQREEPASRPAAPVASASPGGGGRTSQYTTLDTCRVIERSAEGEGDYSTSTCPGLAGYRLKLTEDDLRQSLVVGSPGGGERPLKLSEATGSGGFSRLGETVEWRGDGAGAAFRPDALILRYLVVENAAAPDKETSYLLTVSLDGTEPCVTAKLAPGPDQNKRARDVADRRRACLLG